MNKLTIALLTILALYASIPRANAGIAGIIGGTVTAFDPKNDGWDIADDLGGGLFGGTAILAFGIAIENTPYPYDGGNFMRGLGAMMIIMDADGNLPQGSLEKAFSKNYPFIDDQAVFTNLARAVRVKLPSSLVSGQKFFVSLPEQETREVLMGANLTEAQTEKVVRDLQ